MALVVICGQPCSGKSTVARAIVEAVQQRLAERRNTGVAANQRVMLIDEQGLGLGDRTFCYKDSASEKNLRGMLRSAVSRSVNKDTVVVVDSLNNIKGYRYELWCIARASSTRYCMVYCRTDQHTACSWNAQRRKTEGAASSYPDAIMEDLLRRFEEPDARNRWDHPLFGLHVSAARTETCGGAAEEGVTVMPGAAAEAVSPEDDLASLDEASELPKSMPTTVAVDAPLAVEQPWRDHIPSIVSHALGERDPAGRRGRQLGALQATIATQSANVVGANARHEVDRATQEVISSVMAIQAAAVPEAGVQVHIHPDLPLISSPRTKKLFASLLLASSFATFLLHSGYFFFLDQLFPFFSLLSIGPSSKGWNARASAPPQSVPQAGGPGVSFRASSALGQHRRQTVLLGVLEARAGVMAVLFAHLMLNAFAIEAELVMSTMNVGFYLHRLKW